MTSIISVTATGAGVIAGNGDLNAGHIVGVSDFDHNGVSDIMWLNTSTGHIENWMLA